MLVNRTSEYDGYWWTILTLIASPDSDDGYQGGIFSRSETMIQHFFEVIE